jgi:hypothetical protein
MWLTLNFKKLRIDWEFKDVKQAIKSNYLVKNNFKMSKILLLKK